MKKVVLIGTGMVGASYAYSLLTQNSIDELILIDRNEELVNGHMLDLADSSVMLNSNIKIKAGDYSDCKDADIVCITAGLSKIKDSRMELLEGNNEIISSIVNLVLESGFNGIFLLATNPVDLMSQKTLEISNFDSKKIISSGTNLDTSRLVVELANYFNCKNDEVKTYIVGEHGQSAVPVWSQTFIKGQNVLELESLDNLNSLFEKSLYRALSIIKSKGATYYGIGTSLAQITNAIVNDTKEELLVGVSKNDTYISLPSIIGRSGVENIIDLNLNDSEKELLKNSIDTLKETYKLIK